MLTQPRTGQRDKVRVRLADIDIELRAKAAERLIKDGRLRGVDAMLLGLAADKPIQNPEISVSGEKAWRVLVEKKLVVRRDQ